MINSTLNMSGKVCLITGATSGIGEVTARELAKMGGIVVIAARTQKKAALAIDKIRAASNSNTVEGLVADLTSQSEVRSMAFEFLNRYERLDVLINNAGAVYLRRAESEDGIEMTFAGNHLAPFLLTNLLLGTLKQSSPARIINVSSNSHAGRAIDYADLENRRNYQFMRAYGRSKLGNILFTKELARRLSGSGVTVNAVNPGFVGTNIGANNGWLVKLFLSVTRIWAISVEEGAETSVYLASSPEVGGISGEYFYQKHSVPSSQNSYDEAAAERLWQISAEMTGLDTTI